MTGERGMGREVGTMGKIFILQQEATVVTPCERVQVLLLIETCLQSVKIKTVRQ